MTQRPRPRSITSYIAHGERRTFGSMLRRTLQIAATLASALIGTATASAQQFATVALTENQARVGTYLDQNSAGATGDFATVLTQLNTLTATNQRAALDQISGVVYGTAASINQNRSTYIFTLIERNSGYHSEIGGPQGRGTRQVADDFSSDELEIVFAGNRSDPASIVPVFHFKNGNRPRYLWNAWTTGYGSTESGNSPIGNYAGAGNITSVYRHLSEVAKVGFFGGYNYARVPFTRPEQIVRTDDGQVGNYIRLDDDQSYFLWAQSFGFDDHTASRKLTFGNIDREGVDRQFGGWQLSQYFEVGKSLSLMFGEIEPFAAIQYGYLRQGAVQETGADSLNLNVNPIDSQMVRGQFGARTDIEIFLWHPIPLNLELRASWVHDYLNPITTISSSAAGPGGAGFTTNGLNFGRDLALVGGGLSWPILDRLLIAANYDGFYGQQAAIHYLSGSVQLRW